MKSILKPRAAQGKHTCDAMKIASGSPSAKMTTEDRAADFKDLLAAYDIPDLTAATSSKTTRTATNCDSQINSEKDMALFKYLRLEGKRVILENGEPASSVESNHQLENGIYTDPENQATTKQPIDWNVKGKKRKAAPRQTKQPAKVARVRRKAPGGRGTNHVDPILAPKLMLDMPDSASTTLSALATTDTMIKAIPDLFKNASISTENSMHLMNGPPADVLPLTREPLICSEPLYCDVGYQINANVLPRFEPLLAPPERFNIAIPNDGYRCLDCGDRFFMESSLTQHLQRRSVYITFSCSTCKKVLVFYNRCTLLGHVRVHHDRNQVADIRQATVSPLPRELIPCVQEQISVPPNIGLPPGSNSRNNPTQLLSVIIPPIAGGVSSRSSNQMDCQCFECEQQCGSFLNLHEHFGCSQTSPSKSETRCSTCNMVCTSICSLKAHERIHLQSRPFICPECGQNISESWEDFQRHLTVECMHYSRTVGFTCSACSSLFVTLEQLRNHVLTTHSEAYYKCLACPKAFRAESRFDTHRKTVHFLENLQCSTIRKCPLCEVVYQNHDVLQNHLEDHFQKVLKSPRFLFICTECSELFDSKVPLSYHCQSQHPDLLNTTVKRTADHSSNKKQLKLPKKRTQSANRQPRKLPCLAKKAKSLPKIASETTEPAVPNDKPRIVLSLKGQKSNGNTPEYVVKKVNLSPSNPDIDNSKSTVHCEDCGRTFQTHVGLRVHCQRRHPESYQTHKSSMTKPSNEEPCLPSPASEDKEPPILPEEQNSNDCPLSKSVKERRSSLNSGLNTCAECGREFQTVHGCNVHRQRCHGPDNVKLKCAVCQEYLPDPHLMAEHGHKHLDEGTLVCTLCNNLAFSTKLALSRHIENHATNMKYPLDCLYCNKQFGDVESASTHWKKEHNLLGFQCNKCDSQYLYKKSLHRHVHSVHGAGRKKKLHSCRFCDAEFTKTTLLKKHMEDKHHIPVEEPDEIPAIEQKLPEEKPASPKKEPPEEMKTDKQPSKPASPEPEKSNADTPHDGFVCAKCDFRANEREEFLSHIVVHKSESDSFQCLECGTCFVVEPSLRKHLTCTHKVKDLERFLTENGYTVGSVTNRGGCGQSSDAGHLHNGDGSGSVYEMAANPLECNVCFTILDNSLSLKTHMRTHGMAFIRSKRNVVSQNNEQQDKSSSTPTKNDT